MKKNWLSLLITLPLLLAGFSSCAPAETSSSGEEYEPQTDLESAFQKLKQNNFSIDYYDSYAMYDNVERNEKYYYTDYSLQAEGDLGFNAIAQDDDIIFRYTINGGEIVSGTPMINSFTGIRYQSIYDFIYGMQNFNIRDLPKEKGADGYYEYEFDVNTENDKMILAVFLQRTYSGINPVSLKLKVTKDVIDVQSTILVYDFGEEVYSDTVHSIIYDIGLTENAEIRAYLNGGGTSKIPLDTRFYKLFQPYFSSRNFSLEMDASGMPGYSFQMTEYCTENAIYDVRSGYESGYIRAQGVVSSFTISDGKVNITGTPTSGSSGDFYSDIYGGVLYYTLSDLGYENLIGYIDEEHENSYILTDSQLLYILAYVCYITLSDEYYCDTARIEILDDAAHEFNVYFDLYNRNTLVELGQYRVRFYDLNRTELPAVDRYLAEGGTPSEQTKEQLQSVLTKFSEGNYSFDSLTSAGLAKCYYTKDYFYEELYSDPTNNIGYIRQGDAIYSFTVLLGSVRVDTSTDYAQGDSALALPGCGSYYGSGDDLGYMSELGEGFCDASNYERAKICGREIWKLTDPTLAQRVFNYIYVNPSTIYPMGSGVVVEEGEDPYDTRVTVISSYISADGNSQNYYSFTFYDIGSTAHPTVEAYLGR